MTDERPDALIVARFYLESDPLVQVWQIAYDAREGEPFVNMHAGEILDAMHDASGVRYGYTVGPCDFPDHIALAPLLRQARDIAAEHRPQAPSLSDQAKTDLDAALREARFTLRSGRGGRYGGPVGWGEPLKASVSHRALWLHARTPNGREILRQRVGPMEAGDTIDTAITAAVSPA